MYNKFELLQRMEHQSLFREEWHFYLFFLTCSLNKLKPAILPPHFMLINLYLLDLQISYCLQ